MTTPYATFGQFIDLFNPYAEVSVVADPTTATAGILIAASGSSASFDPLYHTVLDANDLYWPFRLPYEREEWLSIPWTRPFEPGPVTWPGGGIGYTNKIHEVENCRIVKAIVVPYEYDRIIARRSPPGAQTTIKMKAHILIGYTAPFEIQDNRFQPVAPPPDFDQYAKLGQFIQTEHPVEKGELGGPGQPTEIIADLIERDPPWFMNAICWLETKSKEAASAPVDPYPLGSSADDEMQTLDKQQCLTWIFPQRYRDLATGDYLNGWWVRAYQVTKAFRGRYVIVGSDEGGNPLLGGDILVGYSGSGDA
jgi:hypothetical protein